MNSSKKAAEPSASAAPIDGPAAASVTRPASAEDRSDRKTADSQDFGVEGTNKTLAEPQPDATPSEELAGTASKFISKSPYKVRTT